MSRTFGRPAATAATAAGLTDEQQLQQLFAQQQAELAAKQQEIINRVRSQDRTAAEPVGNLMPPLVIKPEGTIDDVPNIKQENEFKSSSIYKEALDIALSQPTQTSPMKYEAINENNNTKKTADASESEDLDVCTAETENDEASNMNDDNSQYPVVEKVNDSRRKDVPAAVITGKASSVKSKKTTARKSMRPAAECVITKKTTGKSTSRSHKQKGRAATPVGPSLNAQKTDINTKESDSVSDTYTKKTKSKSDGNGKNADENDDARVTKAVDKPESSVQKPEAKTSRRNLKRAHDSDSDDDEPVQPYKARRAAVKASTAIGGILQDESGEEDIASSEDDFDPGRDGSDDEANVLSPKNLKFNKQSGRQPKYMKFLQNQSKNVQRSKGNSQAKENKQSNVTVKKVPNFDDYVAKPPPEPPRKEQTRSTRIKVAAVNVLRMDPSMVNKIRKMVKKGEDLPDQLLKVTLKTDSASNNLMSDLQMNGDKDDDDMPPQRKVKPGPASKKAKGRTKEEDLFAYDEKAGIACREGDGKITLPIDVGSNRNKSKDPRFRTLFIGNFGNLKNKYLKVIMKDVDDEPINQCLICCFSSNDPVEVAVHEENYHKDKHECDASVCRPSQHYLFFECRHCNYVTKDRLCLWFHFKRYHNIKKLLRCKYNLNDTSQLEVKIPHLTPFLREHSKEMFKCPVKDCDVMAQNSKPVVLHVIKEHVTSEFVHPGYVSITQEKRSNQNAPAVAREVFVCIECMYFTQGLAHMNTHNYSLHSAKHLLYICKECGEQFVNSQKMLLHSVKEHEGKQPAASVTIIKKGSSCCYQDPSLEATEN